MYGSKPLEPIEFSRHAVQRCLEMTLEGELIRDVLMFPDVVRHYSFEDGRNFEVREKHRVQVVIGFRDGGPRAVTVRWADQEAWDADAARAPLNRGWKEPRHGRR